MVVHLIVRGFGKIKSADIALTDLVLFVGNNNSGKTLMMQLAYGVRQVLSSLSLPRRRAEQSSPLPGQVLIRCGKAWFLEAETDVNRYLQAHRKQIVQEIFGHLIPIEALQIQIEDDKNASYVSSLTENVITGNWGPEDETTVSTLLYENEESRKQWDTVITREGGDAVDQVLKIVWQSILANTFGRRNNQLFLPASRSGLQLLYKYYFLGGAGENLVTPVSDYLRFLLLYSECAVVGEPQRSLLEFGETHLLQGRVVQKGDEIFYIPKQGGEIPLYIASSMIHELTPIVCVLKRSVRTEWLFYDEVENSLHPLMQQEMSRWLIRMVNAGMHVVVSTHSDTMASRLNNLLMMSRAGADYEMLADLRLERADLLRPELRAEIYEFQTEEDGASMVQRLEFIRHPLIGYDFGLFGDNLDKLGEEALRITR